MDLRLKDNTTNADFNNSTFGTNEPIETISKYKQCDKITARQIDTNCYSVTFYKNEKVIDVYRYYKDELDSIFEEV